MRTICFIRLMKAACLLILILVAGIPEVFGQGTASNSIPTVVIYATTPNATFAGKAGVFSVFRQGDTTQSLNVYYCVSGTATNGGGLSKHW